MPLVNATGPHADVADSERALHELKWFRCSNDEDTKALLAICPELEKGGTAARPLVRYADVLRIAWACIKEHESDVALRTWYRTLLSSAAADGWISWLVGTVQKHATCWGGLLERAHQARAQHDNKDGDLTLKNGALGDLTLEDTTATKAPPWYSFVSYGLLFRLAGYDGVGWLEWQRGGYTRSRDAVIDALLTLAKKLKRLDDPPSEPPPNEWNEEAAWAFVRQLASGVLQQPCLTLWCAPPQHAAGHGVTASRRRGKPKRAGTAPQRCAAVARAGPRRATAPRRT